jgi:hypothetical protein
MNLTSITLPPPSGQIIAEWLHDCNIRAIAGTHTNKSPHPDRRGSKDLKA